MGVRILGITAKLMRPDLSALVEQVARPAYRRHLVALYWRKPEGVGMTGKRCSEKFRIAAVKQVRERSYKAVDLAQRPGVASNRLGDWIKRYGDPRSGAAYGSAASRSPVSMDS